MDCTCLTSWPSLLNSVIHTSTVSTISIKVHKNHYQVLHLPLSLSDGMVNVKKPRPPHKNQRLSAHRLRFQQPCFGSGFCRDLLGSGVGGVSELSAVLRAVESSCLCSLTSDFDISMSLTLCLLSTELSKPLSENLEGVSLYDDISMLNLTKI